MDRQTYLTELQQALHGLPEHERQYAIAYYNEFLDDAGPQAEQETLESLGAPHKLAAQIKADMAMRSLEPDAPQAQFAAAGPAPSGPETAYCNTASTQQPQPPYQGYTAGTSGPNAATGQTPPPYNQAPPYYAAPPAPKQQSTLKVIGIVIAAILALPLGLPLAIAIVALVFALLVTVFSLIIAFFATALGLLVAGIVAGLSGIVLLFSDFFVGVFYLGVGLLIVGLALLLGMGVYDLAKLCIKGLAKLFNAIRVKLASRKGGVA